MLTYPKDAKARPAEASEPSADLQKVTPRGVPFIDAGPSACRWPLWETDADPRFVCGAPQVLGSSYCEAHRRRSCERTRASSRSR